MKRSLAGVLPTSTRIRMFGALIIPEFSFDCLEGRFRRPSGKPLAATQNLPHPHMPPPAAVSGGSLYGRLLGYPNKFQGEVWSKLSSASASPSNSLNQRHRCRRCGRLRQPVVGALSFVGVAEFGRVVDPAFPGGHIRLFRCCWRWRFCRRVCRIRYTGVLFNRHPYCCACPTGKPIQRAAGCVVTALQTQAVHGQVRGGHAGNPKLAVEHAEHVAARYRARLAEVCGHSDAQPGRRLPFGCGVDVTLTRPASGDGNRHDGLLAHNLASQYVRRFSKLRQLGDVEGYASWPPSRVIRSAAASASRLIFVISW